MPSYSRYRRRYRRGGYSRYRRRRYYGRYRRFRRSRGSVVSPRSRLRVKIPITVPISTTIQANTDYSAMMCVFPWCNTTSHTATFGGNQQAGLSGFTSLGVAGTQIYQSYAALFDQVKLDGMRATLYCLAPVGNGQTYTGVTLGSTIDRDLNWEDQIPQTNRAQTSASWWSRTAINNSIPVVRRSIWASDLQERSGFTDSDWELTITPSTRTQITSWNANVRSKTFFKPAIWFGLTTPAPIGSSPATINFVAQVTFWLTFRNPKGAAAAGDAAKMLETQLKLEQLSKHGAEITEEEFAHDLLRDGEPDLEDAAS